MKSNILNKVINSVVQEQKMVLIFVIIIGCIYYVINNNRKEGYEKKGELYINKPDLKTLVTRAEYNKLSKENRALLTAHITAKNNALKNSTLRDKLDSYITKLDILRRPFYKSTPTATELAETQYDANSYWLKTANIGINQFFQFQYDFDNAKQPTRLRSRNNYGNLSKLTNTTTGNIQQEKQSIFCNRGMNPYRVNVYCNKPDMTVFIFSNIQDILNKYYVYQPRIVDRYYQIISPKDPSQYGGEDVSFGGFIYALQQFLFSWYKFKLLYGEWLNIPSNKNTYSKTIYIFDQVEIQAFQENNETLLNKPLKGLKNIYNIAREEDTLNYMNADSDTIEDVVKEAQGKNDKPINFIEEEFKDVLRQFLYLGMTFSDIVPTRETDDYAKISDKIDTAVNISQHEKALIDIFGDLSAPQLKNDITYTFINEKANAVTNDFNMKWKELDDAFTYTVKKMYFVYPPQSLPTMNYIT